MVAQAAERIAKLQQVVVMMYEERDAAADRNAAKAVAERQVRDLLTGQGTATVNANCPEAQDP